MLVLIALLYSLSKNFFLSRLLRRVNELVLRVTLTCIYCVTPSKFMYYDSIGT